MFLNKGIHHGIAGADITAEYRLSVQRLWQPGKVSYAADIEHNAVFAAAAKQQIIAIHCQWRALATGGNVLLAKVADGGNAGGDCQMIAIAYLQRGVTILGQVVLTFRAVKNGLAVAGNNIDIGSI